MVNARLKKYAFIFILILINSLNVQHATANESKLRLYIDKNTTVLGRPIRADIYAVSLKTKLTDIQLGKLNKDFGVVTDYVINDTNDKRWPNQSIQILKLKLYPRKTGKIIIPSLVAGKEKTNKKTIQVVSGKTGIPKVILSTKSPYEKQQVIVNISITSTTSTSRLAISKNFTIKGFDGEALPFVRTKERDGSYTNKIGFAISALNNGKQTITLPPIEYSVSGVSRKQFYLPSAIVNIKKLPSYLPPTMPVGKVTIESVKPQLLYLQTNTIYYWDITLSGNINNAYQLPAILRQIKSGVDFEFFPPNITRYKKNDNNMLVSNVNYSIPFKALNSGFLNLPIIKFKYFEPANRKITSNLHQESYIIAFNIFLLTLFILFFVISFIYITNIIIKQWNSFSLSNNLRKKAIELLQDNNTANAREAIHVLSDAENWPKNITLQQWGEMWAKKYYVDNNFKHLLYELSLSLYGKQENSRAIELNARIIYLIQKRKQKKRIYSFMK